MHLPLKVARAERGLRLLQQAAQREYLVAGDDIALRHDELGLGNLENGNLAKAFRNFKEVIRREPDLALAYNNRGLLWLGLWEYEQAYDDFEEAIKLGPDDPITWATRACCPWSWESREWLLKLLGSGGNSPSKAQGSNADENTRKPSTSPSDGDLQRLSAPSRPPRAGMAVAG